MKNEQHKKILIFAASLIILILAINLLEKFLISDMVPAGVIADINSSGFLQNPYESFFGNLTLVSGFFAILMNILSFAFKNSSKLLLLQNAVFIVAALFVVFAGVALNAVVDVSISILYSLMAIIPVISLVFIAVSYFKREKAIKNG